MNNGNGKLSEQFSKIVRALYETLVMVQCECCAPLFLPHSYVPTCTVFNPFKPTHTHHENYIYRVFELDIIINSGLVLL